MINHRIFDLGLKMIDFSIIFFIGFYPRILHIHNSKKFNLSKMIILTYLPNI